MYNFDEIIDRKGTNALNTDGFRGYIFHSGPEKVFPYKDDEFVRMWVADMEFGVAPEILDELRKRIDRRIFGYTGVYTHDYYNSFSKWCKEHYDWSFPEEELCFTPGIIPALYQLTETLHRLSRAARMLVPSSKQRVPILPRYSRRHASSQIWVILQLSTRFMRIILRPSPPAVVLL